MRRVEKYGGKFLERGADDLWYEMKPKDARKKASQVLRVSYIHIECVYTNYLTIEILMDISLIRSLRRRNGNKPTQKVWHPSVVSLLYISVAFFILRGASLLRF